MSAKRFRVHVRDRPTGPAQEMPLIGEIDAYTSFEAIIRHNAIGSWTMTLPAEHDQAALIKPGRGIVVFPEDEQVNPVFSGPIRQIVKEWSQEDGALLTVTGFCDNKVLEERLGLSQPSQSLGQQGRGSFADEPQLDWKPIVVRDGDGLTPNNSGEWIHALIVNNLRPIFTDSLDDRSRHVAHLQIPREVPESIEALPSEDMWMGFPIRLSSIPDAVFGLANTVGLSVRAMWRPGPEVEQELPGTANSIYVTIQPQTDRSDDVVFSPENGNVSSYKISSIAPEITRAVVGAETTTGDRRYYEMHKNDLFDPPGWVSEGSLDTNENRVSRTFWSDLQGRQAIEAEWNTSAEGFVDAREAHWPYQPDFRFGNVEHSGLAWPPVYYSNEAHELARAALKELVEKGPKGVYTVSIIDNLGTSFPGNYQVGDFVRLLLDTSIIPDAMKPESGVIRETVQEVRLSSETSDIWQVQCTVGPAEASETPYVYRELRRLRAQVESDAKREEMDPLSVVRPAQPYIEHAKTALDGPGPFTTVKRPQPNVMYQLRLGPEALSTDVDWVDVKTAELHLETSVDGYTWIRQPQSQIISPAGKNYWYFNAASSFLNLVQLWRARIVKDGQVSNWSLDMPKFQTNHAPFNTGGTITLQTPPGVYRRGGWIKFRGTDTTHYDLNVQELSSELGWIDTHGVPFYDNNNFEIPVLVESNSNQTKSYRVVARNGNGDIVKISNVVSVTWVAD